MRWLGFVLAGILVGSAGGQRREMDQSPTAAPHRTRLILKDGSFQTVMSYSVVGDRVRFVSAERGGETEEIPLKLVDLDATRKWDADHALDANGQRPAPPIDPELAKEEAERALLMPEVAPDLRLVEEDTVLALDTYRSMPELVPLAQTQGDLNRQTGHGIFKGRIDPRSTAHPMLVLKGEKADVQLHVEDPVIYVRLDDVQSSGGPALTVDTHGASSRAGSGSAKKDGGTGEYVIVRVDVRQDARVVSSFDMASLGGGKRQDDVMETVVTVLPGGHWAKIAPKGGLLIGEYALVELLGADQVNLGVWDFGVHPASAEDRDVIRPEKRRTGLGAR